MVVVAATRPLLSTRATSVGPSKSPSLVEVLWVDWGEEEEQALPLLSLSSVPPPDELVEEDAKYSLADKVSSGLL